jgi:hypothetical protein
LDTILSNTTPIFKDAVVLPKSPTKFCQATKWQLYLSSQYIYLALLLSLDWQLWFPIFLVAHNANTITKYCFGSDKVFRKFGRTKIKSANGPLILQEDHSVDYKDYKYDSAGLYYKYYSFLQTDWFRILFYICSLCAPCGDYNFSESTTHCFSLLVASKIIQNSVFFNFSDIHLCNYTKTIILLRLSEYWWIFNYLSFVFVK